MTKSRVQIHTVCGSEAIDMAPDGVSYCTGCECICEGETKYITQEEHEINESKALQLQ